MTKSIAWFIVVASPTVVHGAKTLESQDYTAGNKIWTQRIDGVSELMQVDVLYVFVYCARCQ